MTETTAILVVEDEAIVAADIEMKITSLGYTVSAVATSGEGALALAPETRPALVLMDVHLDGRMDGIDAAIAIRERYRTPVIFVTAFADRKTLDRAKLAQPFGYLVKPFGERDLQVAIEMALGRQEIETRQEEDDEDQALYAALASIRRRRDHLDSAIQALERLHAAAPEKRKRGRPKGSKNIQQRSLQPVAC